MTTILEALKELEAKASTSPWIADTKQRLGENWLLGTVIDLGADDNYDWIVTTNRVRASEYESDAKADAELIALARNHMGKLIKAVEALRRLKVWHISGQFEARRRGDAAHVINEELAHLTAAAKALEALDAPLP